MQLTGGCGKNSPLGWIWALYLLDFCSMGKKEDSYNKRRLRVAYITSVFSVSMVMLVLGILGGILISGKKLAEYARQNLKLQVFLTLNTPQEKANEIKSFIEANEYVAGVVLISPEEALAEYKEKMKEDPMLLLDENPLPTTLEITLQPTYANNEVMPNLESAIMTQYPEEVAEIYKDVDLINDVNVNISKISYILLGLCVLLSLIMIALINNTIRLAIFSKRFLIKTMQLVGATGKFIRKPFIRSGLTQGLIGSLISTVALACIIFWVKSALPKLFTAADYMLFGLLILGVFVLGMLISYVSTRFAVQKFLRLKMDELY
jgi:cell division transport system permease protein